MADKDKERLFLVCVSLLDNIRELLIAISVLSEVSQPVFHPIILPSVSDSIKFEWRLSFVPLCDEGLKVSLNALNLKRALLKPLWSCVYFSSTKRDTDSKVDLWPNSFMRKDLTPSFHESSVVDFWSFGTRKSEFFSTLERDRETGFEYVSIICSVYTVQLLSLWFLSKPTRRSQCENAVKAFLSAWLPGTLPFLWPSFPLSPSFLLSPPHSAFTLTGTPELSAHPFLTLLCYVMFPLLCSPLVPCWDP